MLDRVLQEIRARRRFVVTSHARPDGDGIGSALACGQILRVMGKDAEVVMHDGVPRIYQNLPFAERVIQADVCARSNDAVILLECDSIRRTLLEGLEECFLINIDHHASGRNFAHINWIDSTVMATAELVFRLARLACVPVDRDIATCLYTALMTDTGSFMFEGTNEHTFTVARELVLAGADPALCARPYLFRTFDGEASAAGRRAFQSASRRSAGLDLGDAGTDDSASGRAKRIARGWSTTRSRWPTCRLLSFFANFPIAAIASACAAKEK